MFPESDTFGTLMNYDVPNRSTENQNALWVTENSERLCQLSQNLYRNGIHRGRDIKFDVLQYKSFQMFESS